jgi:hypothetical protein
MTISIEARCEYGGLRLTCDEETFARIRDYLLAEPSIAEAIADGRETLGARFITVRPPPAEIDSRGRSWLSLLMTIAAVGFSGVPLIVGYFTIARWLMRLIA